MYSKDITLFKNLDGKSDDFTIKAKIARLWKQSDYKNPNEVFQIGMVLVDEDGDKIQANVVKKWFPKFARSLQEGVDLYISNPTIAENKSIFKFGTNSNKLNFYYKTEIAKCNDFRGSKHGLLFVDFNRILFQDLPAHVSIDIIGDVVSHTPIEVTRTEKGLQKKRMTLQLQDIEGKRLFCTLWDSFAEQMEAFVTNNPDNGRVIMILQFADVKYYKGRPSISNWFDLSKLYINSDIPEIHAFRERFLSSDSISLSSQPISQVSTIGYSLHDDFLIKTEFKSMLDVIGCMEIKSFIVLGKVVSLDDNQSWYYIACKNCHCKARKPDEDKDVYECDSQKCSGLKINAVPRYRIPLRVRDFSGTATLTLLGYEAFKLFGKSAEDLYIQNKEAGASEMVPGEIEAMIDTQYAFKIEVKEYNLKHGSSVFSVSKITKDEKILTELLKRREEFSVDSNFGSLSDSSTQDTNTLKDSESTIIGENTTPKRTVTSKPVSPIKNIRRESINKAISGEVKRKLDDVYDDDDLAITSSTKAPKRDGSANGVILLIPKLEK